MTVPEPWPEWGFGPRLAALAAVVPEGARVADIGTDHARLPRALLESGRVEVALGCDIAEAPLAAARCRLGPSSRVELRLGPGLAPLRAGEVDVVVLAGFGGRNMLDVLRARDLLELGLNRVVLQPTAGVPGVRTGLAELGWGLVEESLVREGQRGFHTLVAEPDAGWSPSSRLEAIVGTHDPNHPLLRAYLEVQIAHLRRSREGPIADALARLLSPS